MYAFCCLGHTDTIMCCRFDYSGMNLCTSAMDHTSLVWDVRMWKHLLKLRYNLLCVYNWGKNTKKDKQHNILTTNKNATRSWKEQIHYFLY